MEWKRRGKERWVGEFIAGKRRVRVNRKGKKGERERGRVGKIVLVKAGRL